MATYFAYFAVIVGCFFSASLGDVVDGPLNDATLVGNNITITCTSTTTGNERIQFIEYNTNANGALISDGATLLPGHPNFFRHSLQADINAGTYTLTIRNIVIEDGGRYACRDINSSPVTTRYSDLVVFEANPNCTTTLPGNRIVIVGDYYTAECVVYFRATSGISPFMLWVGAGDFAQASTGTPSSQWAGMQFNVQRVQDGRSFACTTNFTGAGFGGQDTATNVPTWQYTYSTGLIFVQYGPTNLTYAPVQQSYEVGQVITCYADAVPLPSYTWTNLETLNDYRSQSVTLTPEFVGGNTRLRCQVVNAVSSANLFVNITVNPITTPTTPTTTTPAPTIPAVAPCDDLTGRWEINHSDGSQSILCINVDATQNGLVRGLWWNDTNEPYFTEIIGRTRNDEYDEIGFSTMWADRQGVSSFAGECHKCRGVEVLLLNAVSRSSADQAFCQDGGTVLTSPQWSLNRVPVDFPCSSNVAVMEENLRQVNAKLPARRRRRMVHPPSI